MRPVTLLAGPAHTLEDWLFAGTLFTAAMAIAVLILWLTERKR